MELHPEQELLELQTRAIALMETLEIAVAVTARFIIQVVQVFATVWIVCFITWRKWAETAEHNSKKGLELKLFSDEPRGSRAEMDGFASVPGHNAKGGH